MGLALPDFTGRRWSYLTFLLLPLLLVVHFYAPYRHVFPALAGIQSSSESNGHLHPIERLVIGGQEKFTSMVEGQSKTLEETVRHYRQRYGRLPPPRFDEWYTLAKEHGYFLVDEFDSIMETLEPFWGIPPSILRARLNAIRSSRRITHFKLGQNGVQYFNKHRHATVIAKWLAKYDWQKLLPDMDFVITTLDEPREAAPYDVVGRAIQNAQASRFETANRTQTLQDNKTDVEWLNIGRKNVWDTLLAACPVSSRARNGSTDTVLEDDFGELPFVSNQTNAQDVCGNPDIHSQVGLLRRPSVLRVTRELVPILAQAKPSIFNDVLYPSPWYWNKMNKHEYHEKDDPEWEQKLDRVYWAGTANGGRANSQNWRDFQRERMVLKVDPDSEESVQLLRQTTRGFWETYISAWSKVSEYFHLRITKIAMCDRGACQAMRKEFDPTPEPMAASYSSKYVIDLDGNSFSGRFYRLLKSKSAVLKQTVMKEWHDGRLVPWVHYIPVSHSGDELGEMMRFLTEEESGRKIGENIAGQGKKWANKVLRMEDMEITFLRILMEHARLLDDDRDSLGYGA